MSKLNFYEIGWYLDEAQCPCDIHLVQYIERQSIRDRTIFHFGTGEHHIVGVRCHELGTGNKVLGITASPREHDFYEKLVIERPELGWDYKVLFGDIYQLRAELLPEFDILSLFHIGEFRTEKNDAYGALTDEAMVRLLIGRLKGMRQVILYSGSYAFDVGIIYKFLDALQLHLVGSYAYGSGDGNAGDGVDHRFRQTGIQENRYQYGGVSRFKYYGESLNPELSNLAVATTAVGFKPSTLSSVDVVAHHYELAHANGGLIAGRLNRQPTGASHNAGNALDLVAGYRDRTAVELEFFGGWFMPGPAFGAHRTDSVYGMFKLKYNLSP